MISRLIVFVVAAMLPIISRAAVTAERSERGVVIKIDGELFTEYLTKAGQSPAMWPIIGPTGKPMTRAYPFEAAAKDGTNDHPHHQSLWFTHDQVNGADYWGGNRNDAKEGGPRIVQRELVSVENLPKTARIVTRNDWMNGDKRVCADERTVEFGQGPGDSRWIDFAITITATDGDVTFGDTKEGTFGVRVADPMRVDAKLGGEIVNSNGLKNQDAWGMPARWVDYTGPVEADHKDEIVGIAIMSHPKSFRPQPRWHVRTYGLFAANLFGQKDFPHPEAAHQGAYTLHKGDSLAAHFRVFMHKGRTDPAAMERAVRDFAGKS